MRSRSVSTFVCGSSDEDRATTSARRVSLVYEYITSTFDELLGEIGETHCMVLLHAILYFTYVMSREWHVQEPSFELCEYRLGGS